MQTGFLVFFITLSFSFGLAYLATFKKLKQSNFALTEIFVENQGLKEAILKMGNNIDNSGDDIHKENFIKFLSDSRDWAFEYIEKSQKTIKEVSDELRLKGLESYSNKLMLLLPENNDKG
jgi:hypothetical protein